MICPFFSLVTNFISYLVLSNSGYVASARETMKIGLDNLEETDIKNFS